MGDKCMTFEDKFGPEPSRGGLVHHDWRLRREGWDAREEEVVALNEEVNEANGLLVEARATITEAHAEIALLKGELKAVETKAGIENIIEQAKAQQRAECDAEIASLSNALHAANEDAVNAHNEAARLKDELQDIHAAHRQVVEDRCAPDEQHCTCVPSLREEIARLTRGQEISDDLTRDERDECKREIASLKAQLLVPATNVELEKLDTLRRTMEERDELKRENRSLKAQVEALAACREAWAKWAIQRGDDLAKKADEADARARGVGAIT
jgi:chromosome segregation ATPase